MELKLTKRIRIEKGFFKNREWPKFDISRLRWAKMPEMKIGNLTAKIPIIQGGMGVGISLSGLAASVADMGGVGVIAANSIGMLDPEYYSSNRDGNIVSLRKEIRKAKAKTKGILGVNIMVAVNDFHRLLDTAIEERIDIVFLGAGLPVKGIPIENLRSASVKVVPIVSSGRAAGIIFKSWMKKYNDIPDGVVVEGPKAGGHLGFRKDQIDDPAYSLENILPDVINIVKVYEKTFSRSVPVIAAGGVYSGKDIYNFLDMGASGVQMGTRFVATHECDADIRFKESYVSCRKEDIGIIKSPVGLPGRAINNEFLKKITSGHKEKIRCVWRCLKSCNINNAPYCISLALDNARKGILDKGFAFAGSNAFKIDKIISVKELLQELQQQYLAAAETGAYRLRHEYEKALEKLISLKEEYANLLKTGLASLKDRYENDVPKDFGKSPKEYMASMEKIEYIKTEYLNALKRAMSLKEELSRLFDDYLSFNLLAFDEL